MLRIEYWLCEKDGEKFSSKYLCEEHEIRLLERDNGVRYIDENGNVTHSFDNAFEVCLEKKVKSEDFIKIQNWYGVSEYEIPNEIGTYVWNEAETKWNYQIKNKK